MINAAALCVQDSDISLYTLCPSAYFCMYVASACIFILFLCISLSVLWPTCTLESIFVLYRPCCIEFVHY